MQFLFLALTCCAFFVHSARGASYGNSGSSSAAGAIPLSALVPPTLSQLYGGADTNIALQLNFPQEPYRWDPYNTYNLSEFIWRFAETNDTLPADNAYIDLFGTNGPYGNNKRAALLSAPLQRWQALNDTSSTGGLRISPYNEGVLEWNNSVTINTTDRILLHFRLSCIVKNAERHPFPPALVSYSDDDPRLANCFIILRPIDDNATSDIYILVTNKSIWAAYENEGSTFFFSKRRIGIRRSYKDIVDIGLEYNAFTNQYTFYVNGEPTWTPTAGVPPPQDGVTKIDFGGTNAGGTDSAGTTFTFEFGTHKCLDESDPWNQNDTTRLVRQFTDAQLYGNSMFYDNDNMRSNNLWDQTVKMTLYDVTFETASAIVQPMPADNGGGNSYQASSSGSTSYGK